MSTPPRDFLSYEFSIVHKAYEFYRLIHTDLKNFPKNEKYSLGQKIENTILEIIEYSFRVWGKNITEKIKILNEIQIKIDLLRIFIRLGSDIDIYSKKQYIFRESKVVEMGKILGTQIKKIKEELGIKDHD